MSDPHRIGEADRHAGEERGGRLLEAEFIFSSMQQQFPSCPKPADVALQTKSLYVLRLTTSCQAIYRTTPNFQPHRELHPEEYKKHWSLCPRLLPVRLGALESYSAG